MQLVTVRSSRTLRAGIVDGIGHGFHNEENRFDFYRRMESFLARHLGSRAENLPPA